MVGRDKYNNNDNSNINIINNVSHHVPHPYSMSIDSGATTHAFTKENTGINNDMVHINLPFSNITKTPNGIKIMYPDGNTVQATQKDDMDGQEIGKHNLKEKEVIKYVYLYGVQALELEMDKRNQISIFWIWNGVYMLFWFMGLLALIMGETIHKQVCVSLLHPLFVF